MSDHPHISVLLPVYNAEEALPAALESLLTQRTARPFEIVAVDDGSTDATPQVLAAAARRDPRVRPVRLSHGGLVAALNAGLAHCRGAYIARMDADDISLPDRLERQAALLDADPGTGVVSSLVAFGGDAARQAGYAHHVAWQNRLLTHRELSLWRFVDAPMAHPSVMFRRELPERFGAYRDGDFPEDFELWLRWLEHGVRLAKIPETLLVWNDPPQRLSRSDARYAPEAFYRTKAAYLARWLAAHNPFHPEILAWGSGRISRQRWQLLCACGVRIRAYVDISPRRIGQRIHGLPVLAPAGLPPQGTAFVVAGVARRDAHEVILSRLGEQGYALGRDAIFMS